MLLYLYVAIYIAANHMYILLCVYHILHKVQQYDHTTTLVYASVLRHFLKPKYM